MGKFVSEIWEWPRHVKDGAERCVGKSVGTPWESIGNEDRGKNHRNGNSVGKPWEWTVGKTMGRKAMDNSVGKDHGKSPCGFCS